MSGSHSRAPTPKVTSVTNRSLCCSLALVSAFLLGGCGIVPGAGPQQRTVSIWLMKDSVSDDFLKRFITGYEKDNPSVKLKFTFQEWTGIGKKVTDALESKKAPDVIEVGNTQVAQYAESDALHDLTLESVRDLGNDEWLPGLAEPGSINGSQYGIPWYAANRIVIYNKDLFADAGISRPPEPAPSGSKTPRSSTTAASRASTSPVRTGTPSPGSSGTRADSWPSSRRPAGRAR